MKTKQLNKAQSIILSWYNNSPEAFDTSSNTDWLMIYLQKWCGSQFSNEAFMRMRMKQMSYESFRRAVQYLIEKSYIKLSPENMKKRHRAEAETRETILTNPTPNKHLVFLTDSMGRKSEVWI